MYLMRGMAALAMGLVVVSCNKMDFSGQPQVSTEEAMANAEMQLGVTIDPNQDWNMTKQVTAKVNVNMGTGKTYNYVVYSNDPLSDRQGVSIAKGTVTDGGNINAQVTCPSANTQLVVSLTDADNITYYKRGNIEDSKVSINFTTATTRSVAKRTITVNGDAYDKFPSAGDVAAYFPTSIPADAKTDEEIEAEWKGKNAVDENGNEIIADWGGKIQMWDLYAIYMNMVGKVINNIKVTAPGEFKVGHNWANPADRVYNVYIAVGNGNSLTLKREGAEHVNFYIMSGNVTIDSNFGECGGIISVAEGATVNDQRTHIAHNDGVKVFNKGTYNATNTTPYWNGKENTSVFDIGNFCTFYNEGKFNCSGGMSYSPGDGNHSYFVNMGDDAELTATSMTLNSTGNFFNSGKVNIAGETNVTQKDIYWVNAGNYTTGSMTFSAKNATFYNYCQLKVKGNAHMYDGEFNLMDNSYTEAGSAEMDNFIVNMGSNTGMYVKGTMKLEAQGDGTYQGFRTSASGDALRVDGTITVACHRHTLSVSNGITFGHNAIKIMRDNAEVTDAYLKEIGDGCYPVLDLGQCVEVTANSLDIQPSASGCGGSAQVTPDPDPVPVVYPIYSYAFEDTHMGDYDMNDIVLKVQENEDGENIDIKLVAAGATLDLNIRLYTYDESGENGYGDSYTTLSYNGETEIHKMLGVDAGTMVNTGAGANANPITIQIPKSGNDPAKLRIAIYSVAQGEMRLAGSGQAPYGVVIPADWKWPRERVNVKNAYNYVKGDVDMSFRNFAENAGQAEEWYNYPTGSVMK